MDSYADATNITTSAAGSLDETIIPEVIYLKAYWYLRDINIFSLWKKIYFKA
jgi:hypothetical protein